MPTTTPSSRPAAVPPARGAIPYLTIKGAADAIAYYQRVFGAETVARLEAPNGAIVHCELKVGPASFMLTEEMPQYNAHSPASLGGSGSMAVLYVPDADVVFERALAAGAKMTMPIADQFWGDRSGGFVDPFGHKWMVSTHKEDPTPEELTQRFQKMLAQGAPGC